MRGSFFPVLSNAASEPVIPELISATIDTDGITLTLVFSEAVSSSSTFEGDPGKWTVSSSGVGIPAWTYVSGNETDTVIISLDNRGVNVFAGDVITISSNADTVSSVATTNLMLEITDYPVTNNSTQDITPPTLLSAVFTDTVTLTLTLSENVVGGSGSMDPAGFFIDDGHGNNKITNCLTDGSAIIVCSGSFSGGETLDFTGPTITDLASNPLADFTGFATTGP